VEGSASSQRQTGGTQWRRRQYGAVWPSTRPPGGLDAPLSKHPPWLPLQSAVEAAGRRGWGRRTRFAARNEQNRCGADPPWKEPNRWSVGWWI